MSAFTELRKLRKQLDALNAAAIDEKAQGGRPPALSAEQVREMQARAVELWREYGDLEGAQGRVGELLRIEWRKRGIDVGFSTIIRHVMKPIGF